MHFRLESLELSKWFLRIMIKVLLKMKIRISDFYPWDSPFNLFSSGSWFLQEENNFCHIATVSVLSYSDSSWG